MVIQKAPVYFENPTDPDWGEDIIVNAYVIGEDWTIEISPESWTFRKVTGRLADGTPKVDLEATSYINIGLDYEAEEVDLNWLMSASLMEIVEKLAKN
ncbi:hypothetical protein [Bacillus sp. mrc49]|uniref:hypothetical protein n=1 Tax=Bacillus sp. mrc49 TaxID=2054913 RepID=UPI000C275CFD|nr:hypothetical protein [Bacillus sp. mrc49]PJN90594.1 hypothetical protein CVN76_09555 [Bacillus sp. mrc49]